MFEKVVQFINKLDRIIVRSQNNAARITVGSILGENQVHTETLNSTNLKAEKASQNDIMSFMNEKIMLR